MDALPEHFNISQEINRMIPVRGPTIFDKQFSEFIHGVQSKSGGNPMMRQMARKLSAKINVEI